MTTEDGHRTKRFKYQSHQQSLQDVHPPSALNQSQFDKDVDDNDSHFREALDHWRQLNLSPAFLKFANQAHALCASMPLLLHNWREIVDLWIRALKASDAEALPALLDLLQKLIHDLRTTLLPVYDELLQLQLSQLPQSLPPSALTAVLATLSTTFKYLLIPSTGENMLQATWTSFRATMPTCDPEVQRASGEMWGTVLRRMKGPSREGGVRLVASTLEGVEDAVAWALVSACSSVSQTLHTATVSLFTTLLDSHLDCDDVSRSYTLVRRVTTALIHHCKSADRFAPLAQVIASRFIACTQHAEDARGEERLRRMLEVVSVPLAVRQGSRMPKALLVELASAFPSIPLSDALYSAVLRFATATLVAGDAALWLGSGRAIVARAWTRLSFGAELSGVLAQLEWGGWKMIALPLVHKMTPALIAQEPKVAAKLLNVLARQRKLGDVDVVWRKAVEGWVEGRLERWQQSEDSVLELQKLFALSAYVPSTTKALVSIINRTLEIPEPRADYDSTFANSAWVLGASMEVLAKQKSAEWSDLIDLAGWTRKVVDGWSWSTQALSGLVALISASGVSNASIPFEDLYVDLQDSLTSHSHALRLGVLRLLSSPLVQAPPTVRDVVKRCLQGEEVSLDVRGVRERVLRVGRVGQAVHDGDEVGADVCARWLIAQLKVSLRPLWSPVGEALASLASRFGDLVWERMFSELKGAFEPSHVSEPPNWMPVRDSEDEADDAPGDPWEEERTWRDPSAHKVRSIVHKWLQDEDSRIEIVKSQRYRDRLDATAFGLQLLSTLGDCSSLVEKHNRDFVTFFLTLAGPGDTSKLSRVQLSGWLTMFSTLRNPKALYSSEVLHALYISLLSHPDRSLQRLALSCILTYKSSHLLPHEERLRLFLDDTRWRDEIASLDMDEIQPQDRGELVDILIRLFFGLMLEKKTRSRGVDRRAAVLGVLGGCTDEELALLVDLMLKPLGSSSSWRPDSDYALRNIPMDVTEKQQVGFLNLLGDVLKYMGPRLVAYWPALLGATIDITSDVQRRIQSISTAAPEETESLNTDEAEDVEVAGPAAKTTRTLRSLGLKRFTDFFRSPAAFDFGPYLAEAFRVLVSPRLPSLDKENTQAPSALLDLFFVWTLKKEHVHFLVKHDSRTLPQLYNCLIAANVKPAVVTRIFDIVDRVLAFAAADEEVTETIVKPHVSHLLGNLAVLVQRSAQLSAVSSPLAQRQISILSGLSNHLVDSQQASTLLGLFLPLLRKTNKIVPEKVKADILIICSRLVPLVDGLADSTTSVHTKTFETFAQLFQRLRLRSATSSLVFAFQALARVNPDLQIIGRLLEELHAYSAKRIEEPDFDRRIDALNSVNDRLYSTMTVREWLPIIYSALLFVQDPDELAVRNNAAYTMRRFIDLAVERSGTEYEVSFMRVLWPGLKNGLKSKHELVRAEILGVIAYAVTRCDREGTFREMRALLAGGDEEANFFNNLYHVQIHRRTRALRRLAEQCDEGHLSSNTLAEILVPLVGHNVVPTTSQDHLLVNEAILTVGRMSKHLAWGAYYALVQKYLKLSKARDESERVYIRTLVQILDNFHFQMEDVVADEVHECAEPLDAADEEDLRLQEPTTAAVAHNKPGDVRRVSDAVQHRLLPSLLDHLERRDATEDTLRLPIATGIVRVAQHLPGEARRLQTTKVITVLSQILRSKSSETRDLTRETLCRIAVTLGPSYLQVILRQMRDALLRGPHLHILAYVTHAILVHVTTGNHAQVFDALDDCVSDVAHIASEVIFGESGRDVQAESFKTKMREVRSSASKSLDSFAITAKFITPPKISGLLQPLRGIMQETSSLKPLQQVDEVLRRIAGGLNSNEHLGPAELLVLCHTLISQNAKFLQTKQPSRGLKRKAKAHRDEGADAVVQVKRDAGKEMDHYMHNSYRFVTFGLDLFETAFRRSRFDFSSPTIISRLDALAPTIGNALYSTSTPVLLLALKASADITRCPIPSLSKFLPVFIRQIIDIVRQTGSTESEVVQGAFKALAIILREHSSAQVKEEDLVYLLELVTPDLEDPARQSSVFALLRAILSRKFVLPEIYDLMSTSISHTLLTSQSPHVQAQCRALFLQFLLDYPQGKGRLRTSMTFLARNVSYVHESGRMSVLELLHAIVNKFEGGLVAEYSDLLFVALVMVLANDESSRCREMASEVIKALFRRLDEERRGVVMGHLHKWAEQCEQPQLIRVSAQVYGLVIDVFQGDVEDYVPVIIKDMARAIEGSAASLAAAEIGDEDETVMDVDLDWQAPYHALIVLSKLLKTLPPLLTTEAGATIPWSAIIAHLLFPHAWVRTASCRLLGTLFSTTEPASSDLGSLRSFAGLDLKDVADKLGVQLKSEHLEEALGVQVVKNLFWIGKRFCAIPLPADDAKGEAGGDDAHDARSEDEDVDDSDAKDGGDPLPWLFSKLSYQIRSAHIARVNRASSKPNWFLQPQSILRWFAAMATYMDASRSENFLVHILSPVYRILEDETVKDSGMDELKTLCTELMGLLQSKIAPTTFSNVYSRIRQGVVSIQRERKTKRAVRAAADPAADARRKMRRGVAKKEGRKKHQQDFMEKKKGKFKRRRDES